MTNDVSSFVERYQILYEKDPRSKIFAPLTEAYRRMGLVDEAIDLALEGIKNHPHFASGRVALGKCYVEKGLDEKAVEQLKTAVDLSPENLLAHQLLAECYARMKRPVEALNEFKLVLFLNPTDANAAAVVKKLEAAVYAGANNGSAVADFGEAHYDSASEDFSMENIRQVEPYRNAPSKTPKAQPNPPDRQFEQELALLDTRYDRGDWVNFRTQLDELLALHPDHPELVRRKANLDEMTQSSFDLGEFLKPLKTTAQVSKVDRLRSLLELIEARRKA